MIQKTYNIIHLQDTNLAQFQGTFIKSLINLDIIFYSVPSTQI